MKRTSLFLIAAVMVVALAAVPAMACNTNPNTPYKAKSPVDFWEYCSYAGELNGYGPVGPASYYGSPENPVDILIHFAGEQNFNAKVKNDKVTWHRHVHGSASVYAQGTGGSSVNAAAAMSVAPRIVYLTSSGQSDMFLFSCFPVDAPQQTPAELLHEGPFHVEELVKDLGNNAACFDPANPAPVSFYECSSRWNASVANIDYMMHHVKITGPGKPYHFKTTIHELGKICFEEKRGWDSCGDYAPAP